MVRRGKAGLDRDLADLPPDLRWRAWLRRIEAVLFASATPVVREHLARVVGQGASVDLLIEDLAIDLEGRPYAVAQVGAGWMLRTGPAYAPAIRAAADVGGQALTLSEFDLAVLAAIAFHQPVSREGLKEIFGTEISRDLIGRLAGHELIGTGPREPRRGAPHTFVTTETFLAAFGMQSLRDLPDPGQLADAGLAGRAEAPALQKGGDPSAQDRHPPEADRQAAPERPDRVP
ncbi:MAG: SMC-Scp complex subunit ScpB [Rhodobacter sp.]|nr:SMC-Scp complex subunit ScpB [Rhodobacter sp.]MCA3457047.1 SMC-Scp complex subunit ScpB [Rhodobacter sp.]MCA3460856.1 SMC-Scp complex subunit ScpB [Rhodobacter sp.]MCA3465183.1 SMC-Scp complex subunit ScpB [Rhodobacter sp.]MCA3467952.1 SMC-Scp complex subunit ScpB [Rhodobacter sp.]